ncbi:MAG: substrate-binding domain-containing protein [Anaerolineae bacterium]|nr:substrate-binding domain-containing protein [Anaerolineae bacterium]
MSRKTTFILLIVSLLLLVSIPLTASAQAEPKVFYWISHGAPADPVWVLFLQGAEKWAEDTGFEVRTSFHSGDVASQQEAVRAAIAAGATGIVTSTPDPGALTEVISEAHAAGIPVIIMNTEDKTSGRDAYVGGDNYVIARNWALYLVDNGYVTEGSHVWCPVEVPGATYQVNEVEGINSVFGPLGIECDITDATLDQAEIITRMSDYLTANRDSIDAVIGLGDLVTGSVKRVFDQVGVAAGDIPVVGWGNSLDTAGEVLEGYVLAATWQDPLGTSYLALSQAMMAASGIPPSDIILGTMYTAENAAYYQGLME